MVISSTVRNNVYVKCCVQLAIDSLIYTLLLVNWFEGNIYTIENLYYVLSVNECVVTFTVILFNKLSV